MIGLILAAGAGKRLGNNLPKCLTRIGGMTILQRQIAEMKRAGISDIYIVVGYRNDDIRRYVNEDILPRITELNIAFDINPRFLETNTARSLEIGLRSCRGKREPVLFLNGDVVFEDDILPGFTEQIYDEHIVVFVQKTECGEEEIKIVTDGEGNIVSIGKHIETELAEGEGIGINYVPASLVNPLIDELGRCQESDFFEKAFDKLTAEGIIKAFDIGNRFAIEIDFPDDLLKARDWVKSLSDNRS